MNPTVLLLHPEAWKYFYQDLFASTFVIRPYHFTLTTRSLCQGREISSEAVLRRQMRFPGFRCFFLQNPSGEHLWRGIQPDHLWASLLQEIQVWIQTGSLSLWHTGRTVIIKSPVVCFTLFVVVWLEWGMWVLLRSALSNWWFDIWQG